jgi:hypothetical protein
MIVSTASDFLIDHLGAAAARPRHHLSVERLQHDDRTQGVEARERAKGLPGFRDNQEGLLIDCYAVDRDHWTEGFVTVKWEQ